MYIDAWDWVVEPNVLAMGTFSVGNLMTTKPYVSGAAYINRMSDYCSTCAFDPKSNCPVTRLYWSFLERKRDQLSGNPRMGLPLASTRKRSDGEKEIDRVVYSWLTERLAKGQKLTPADLPAAVAV
jgi:deoxyribodipyrimidine photolyase-related protein